MILENEGVLTLLVQKKYSKCWKDIRMGAEDLNIDTPMERLTLDPYNGFAGTGSILEVHGLYLAHLDEARQKVTICSRC